MKQITIDEYLQKVTKFANSDYGRLVRTQFADSKGDSELAMLVAPTKEEVEQFKKAIAIMTADEKTNAAALTDEQVQKIAADAGVDQANLAIFFNGFALHCKKNI
jgi:signal recognition particle GTPase